MLEFIHHSFVIVRHLHRRQIISMGDMLAQAMLYKRHIDKMKIPPSHQKGFTLVEIMIVVAIIALLAAIAVPGFLRARKRSQASRILNDLRMIDAAVDQYAIETNRSTGNTVAVQDWTNYLKQGTSLYNTGASLLGSPYGAQTVDQIPQVPSADYNVLSDVANTGFWSPYGP
jgi:prepilin-type N-terminal cleavage/methylation domain-containing protein